MKAQTETLLSQYLRLLQNYAELPKPVLKRTFMQISGYPHYENVCSNVLAFFLQPNNEHGLGDLVLKAFFTAAGEETPEVLFSSVSVEREVGTDDRKRLDLLVTAEGLTLGIENKIQAPLYNDLKEYGLLIDKYSYDKQDETGNSKALKIVLSLKDFSDIKATKAIFDSGFKSITYPRLFMEIRARLGDNALKADPKYLLYLNDFIQTIEEIQNNNMKDEPTWAFFREHYEQIDGLISDYNKFKEYLADNIRLLWDLVGHHDDDDKLKQRKYGQSCLVNDFIFPEGIVTVDTYIRPSGWEITIFPRGHAKLRASQAIKAIEQKLNIKLKRQKDLPARMIAGEFPPDVDLSEVAERLKIVIQEVSRLVATLGN